MSSTPAIDENTYVNKLIGWSKYDQKVFILLKDLNTVKIEQTSTIKVEVICHLKQKSNDSPILSNWFQGEKSKFAKTQGMLCDFFSDIKKHNSCTVVFSAV